MEEELSTPVDMKWPRFVLFDYETHEIIIAAPKLGAIHEYLRDESIVSGIHETVETMREIDAGVEKQKTAIVQSAVAQARDACESLIKQYANQRIDYLFNKAKQEQP